MQNQQYKNSLQLTEETVGIERKMNMLSDILQDGTFLPKTVLYKDIDEAFKKFVEEKLHIVSDEGKELPTMVLFSNQRFSEYTQSWQHVDENKNLILNFKTISRENNPQYGNIQSRLWNIPGERFYLIKRQKVMDDNGTESYLDYKMKQPMAVDLNYKVTIFCLKYQLINDFNILVNDLFKSRQCYIWPNNHPMPMTLEGINDESSYQIDDRQFYGQTYNIKLMGYVIQESDFKVEEIPLKKKMNLPSLTPINRKCAVEIDDDETEIYVSFPSGCTSAKFTLELLSDNKIFEVGEILKENIGKKCKILVDNIDIEDNTNFNINDGIEVEIFINKIHKREKSTLIFKRK